LNPVKPFNFLAFRYLALGNINQKVKKIKLLLLYVHQYLIQNVYVTKKKLLNICIKNLNLEKRSDITSGLLNDLRRLGIVTMLGKYKKKTHEIRFLPEWMVSFWTGNMVGYFEKDPLEDARRLSDDSFKHALASYVIFLRPIVKEIIPVKLARGMRAIFLRGFIYEVLDYIQKNVEESQIIESYEDQLHRILINPKKYINVLEKLSDGNVCGKKMNGEIAIVFSEDFIGDSLVQRYLRMYEKRINLKKYREALLLAFIEILREENRLSDILSGKHIVGYYPLSLVANRINEHLGLKLDLKKHIDILKSISNLDDRIRLVGAVSQISDEDFFVGIETEYLVSFYKSRSK